MDGLLLHLLDSNSSDAGSSFWPCFEPLRSEFDGRFWIFLNQPWSPPLAFDDEREMADFEGVGETSVGLWRPGAVTRWAEYFSEEFIDMWTPDPSDDPARMASAFSRTSHGGHAPFIQTHAQLSLHYTDSTCWELFARIPRLLQSVRDHLQGNVSIKIYESSSAGRARAFDDAGIGEVWRVTHGQAH